MNIQDEHNLSDEEVALLGNSINDAWNNCLPMWIEFGRIDDYGVQRRPRYAPWLGRRISNAIADRYYQNYACLFQFLESDNPITRLIAFELLVDCCYSLLKETKLASIPDDLKSIKVPIHETILDELIYNEDFDDFEGKTIGEYLAFLLDDDSDENE